MPFPTVTVTEGQGKTVNTLPNAGQAGSSESLSVVLSTQQEVILSAIAKDGADGSGITPPTGGSGIRGWLSGCFDKLSQILTKLNGSVAVTGTFWQATQPVSAASLPLPTGAANWVATQADVTTSAASPIIAARAGRRAVVVTQLGTTDVWLGPDNTVSPTTGALLKGVAGAAKTIPWTGAVYAVTASSTQRVSVEEIY
jgi:hypothetical protein